jgi:trimethylamine--corrinoid protein Co-methyltransferase
MLELLSHDDVERIHSAVVEILEGIGVMMPHERALEILKESGAEIDSKNKIARIPEHLVKEALNRAPKRYSLTARNPHFNIELGDGTPHFTNAYGAHYTIDLETGQRRSATLKDLEDFTRLSDYFQTVDYIKSNIIPQDVPRNIVEQKTALAEFRSSEKHRSANSMTPEGFRDVIRMALVIKKRARKS